MSSIIAYDKYKQSLEDAEQLKRWSVDNIVSSYIDKLDDMYYDTGMTGWEALFQYITYEEDYEESFFNKQIVVDEEQLYKMVRLANHEMNKSSESSAMDEHHRVGYFGLEDIEESIKQTKGRGYKYTIIIYDLEVDYPGSEIYNVVELSYPEEVVLTLNRDDADPVDLYDMVKRKVEDKLEYGIDSPEPIEEVEITYMNFDISSIERI